MNVPEGFEANEFFTNVIQDDFFEFVKSLPSEEHMDSAVTSDMAFAFFAGGWCHSYNRLMEGRQDGDEGTQEGKADP